MTELADGDRLMQLIREHSWTKHRKVLFCAQDVADYIAAHSVQPDPWESPEERNFMAMIGIEICPTPDSAPGTWRLVRHDHCEVVSVDKDDGTPDWEKSHVRHGECTVLAESEPHA